MLAKINRALQVLGFKDIVLAKFVLEQKLKSKSVNLFQSPVSTCSFKSLSIPHDLMTSTVTLSRST